MRGLWLCLAVGAGIAAILMSHAHLARTLLALVALGALALAAWDVETALGFLLVYLPFRTLVEAVAPTPLKFAADVAVLVVVARAVLLHPQRIFPLDAIEWLGVAFAAVALAVTAHAHASLAGGIAELRDLLLFWLLYAGVRRLRLAGDGPGADFWARAVPLGLASIAFVGLQGMVGLVHGGAYRDLLLPGPWLHEPISAVNAHRPYGLVNNPNVYGELGFIALILTLDRLRAAEYRRSLPSLALAALFVAMIAVSGSRTTWIISLVGLVAYFATGRRAVERVAIAAAAAGLAVGVLAPPPAHHRIVSAASHATIRRSIKSGRLQTVRLAMELARRHPTGTGLATFGSGASRVFNHRHTPGAPRRFYADDEYAALLVETGLFGFGLFLATGLSVFARLARAPTPADGRLCAFVLFLAIAIVSGAANGWEQLNLTLYPWLALAVLAVPFGGRTPERPAALTA